MTFDLTDMQLATVRNVTGLIEFAENALETPSDSGWFDEELWKTHTLVLGTPDISLTDDYLVGWSNYRSILRDLSEEFPGDVENAEFGHWTYSKFKAIKIRVVDDMGWLTDAFVKLFEIVEDLKQTALYDEDDFSELEEERRTELLTEIADDNKVSYDGLRGAMEDLNVYYVPGYGFDMYKVTEEQLIEKARELSTTFQQHVESGPHHYADHCYYCTRAVEGIPA